MLRNPDSSLKNQFCYTHINKTFTPINEIDSSEVNLSEHVIEIAVNIDKKLKKSVLSVTSVNKCKIRSSMGFLWRVRISNQNTSV